MTPPQVLLWPNVRRLLSLQPFWALAFATFFKALEMANPAHSAPPLSFVHYLVADDAGGGRSAVVRPGPTLLAPK